MVHRRVPAPCRLRGISLIELMIALTLGLLILAGLTTIFVNNNKTRIETERVSRQIENGRYAMELIHENLRVAGFYGEYMPPEKLPAAITAKPDACATDVATMGCTSAGCAAAPSFLLHIQGYDNGSNAPDCLTDRQANTDVLVVRRASTCMAGAPGCDALVAGTPYFQSSLCTPPVPGGTVAAGTELGNVTNPCPVCNDYFRIDTATANLTLHKKDCRSPNLADRRRYITHIYYIANNGNAGDGIPTLKRAELGAGGFTIVPLVEGIENLQIEYGIDTSGDGTADVFTANPDAYVAASLPPTCLAINAACNWWNVVSVKLNLLARNTEASASYTNNKTYVLGARADGSAMTVGPFNDGFRRHAYNATIRLDNPSGRRQ